MDLNKSLHTICTELNYYNLEFNKREIESWGQHDSTSFAQIVRIFGTTNIINITPGEIDYAFNTLLRDNQLMLANLQVYTTLAEYLQATIAQLMKSSTTNKSNYRKEYTRFMTEREQYRNKDTTNMISQFNNHVIKGMCSGR